ncbi:8-oxoguanine deaminase [Candidatus Poribacteria bacterium]|nr:8-oxoguanine deaminase [Candidatus Poribacteria bacterium]
MAVHDECLLLENCRCVATFDDAERELAGVDILIEGPRVAAIGPNLRHARNLPPDIAAIDASSHLVLPGLVNCHHHMYQVLTRVVGRVQNAELFEWLVEQYALWEEIDPESVHLASLVAMSELLLTGCTTTTDHHYLFPLKAPVELIDEEIRSAQTLGMRFHPTRGSMSLGVNEGGLPPMTIVEPPDRILNDYDRVISKYHDDSPFSMLRIALAPCAPMNAREDLFRETARLARHYGVRMHTHLAETADEDDYCIEHFGCRPLAYVAQFGWEGPDVWFAHCVKLNQDEILRCAKTGTGIAHCPASNCRLGSGIAPVPAMIAAGVKVGLGVDGSSSNDSGNMIGEARQAFLTHRANEGVQAMDARTALRLATRGGAAVLGNDKIGRIQEGCAADVILIDLEQYQYAGGASLDPVSAAIFCGTNNHVDYSIINGRIVVERGRICRQTEKTLVRKVNEIAAALVGKTNTKRRIDHSIRVDWPRKTHPVRV